MVQKLADHASKMTPRCPHCDARFRLTWPRYFASLKGRYACPHCGRAMRFATGWKYWALYLPGLGVAPVLLAAGAVLAASAASGNTPGRLLYLLLDSGWLGPVIGLLFVLTLACDRAIDERYRRLVPDYKRNNSQGGDEQ
jgi:hypothetical protein